MHSIAGYRYRRAGWKVKNQEPLRTGTAWVALDDRAVLLERRPARGLLGGTLAFPTTGWDGTDLPPPQDGPWDAAGEVRHVFTHFELRLSVLRAPLANPARGEVTPRDGFDPNTLPGLMRKVWALAS